MTQAETQCTTQMSAMTTLGKDPPIIYLHIILKGDLDSDYPELLGICDGEEDLKSLFLGFQVVGEIETVIHRMSLPYHMVRKFKIVIRNAIQF